MATSQVQPAIALKNILYTTDFSDASLAALPFASSIARRNGSNLYLLHVVAPLIYPEIPFTNVDIDADSSAVYKKLEAITDNLDLPAARKETITRGGYFWEVVQKLIAEKAIDLIVIGTHGYGPLKRMVLGSCAELVFRNAKCPVLTVGPLVANDTHKTFSRVLFAANLDKDQSTALNYALMFAREYESELVIAHVVEPIGVPLDYAETKAREAEKKIRAMLSPAEVPPRGVSFMVKTGIAAEELVKIAADTNSDLIVMGAKHSGTMATHMPFNTGEWVIAHASCPVLTLAT